MNTNIPEDKKIYFASDFHLGIPDHESSLKREKMLVRWLEEIRKDAAAIYLMGDVFDFWFEYKTVVPRGFTRLLGKLAEITDQGIPVHLFRGNHDVWAFNYLNLETGITLHRAPQIKEYNGKLFYLAHGDGLGPGDKGYKMLKKIFACRLCQWLFRWLHPDLGARMGLFFSGKSRLANIAREGKKENNTNGYKDEMLYQYTLDKIKEGCKADYYIFGHRHLPLDIPIGSQSHLIILGDWITNFTYAVFDGKEMKLTKYTNP
ncbi:MAG: UDP-2,3-diacylglucosamine diphosphatase [Bacteroidetes bacterium]|nr:UDP-2,3-diacylglucosamine diphosphatase [Bacteroidota bacterium]